MDPLSKELDGLGLVQWIESSEEAYNKWLTNLILAEHNGHLYYKALSESGAVPNWLKSEVRRLSQQEFVHYSLVTGLAQHRGLILPQITAPAPSLSLERVDLDENRAVMRFWNILEHSRNSEAIKIARRILRDEEYHTGITAKLLEICGPIEYKQF